MITITDPERDMIIAALRLWQRQGPTSAEIAEIARNGRSHYISDEQIDALIEEKINREDPAKQFMEQISRMMTIEDSFHNDPEGYEDADDMRSDLSDDRLMDELSTLESLIEKSREILGVESPYGPPAACENCGCTDNDGSDICPDCGGEMK